MSTNYRRMGPLPSGEYIRITETELGIFVQLETRDGRPSRDFRMLEANETIERITDPDRRNQ